MFPMTQDSLIDRFLWDKAYAEYNRRFVDNASNYGTSPSLLLVATSIKGSWTPGEELRNVKYLFFPVIDHDGATLSALFIVYMPGPEHGAADAYSMFQV